MLNTEGQREIVVSGLKKYLGCEVVRTNQTAEIPAFPFLGYNIINPMGENKGTYGEHKDGKARKTVTQTYSFKAQSEDFSQSLEIANKARSWLDFVGTQYLNDNDVVVVSVGSVSDRSNLLTSDYIYEFGFDCVFSMVDEIDLAESEESKGEIESVTFKENIEI